MANHTSFPAFQEEKEHHDERHRILASNNGRVTRGAAGVILIVAGVALGGAWWTLAVIGLVPLAAAIFHFWLLGPLMHRSISGQRLRADVQQR